MTTTIQNTYKHLILMAEGLCRLFDREISAMNLLENTEAKDVFIMSKRTLCDSIIGVGGFNGCVRILSTINSCAKNFEDCANSEPLVQSYWLQHAYELRVCAEQAATNVLHASENVPRFEESLARLRISCAYLAKRLGDDTAANRYAQGALRLAAPETNIEFVKSVMQTH